MYVICLRVFYHSIEPKSSHEFLTLLWGDVNSSCTTFASSLVPVDCIKMYRFCFVVKI